MYRPFTTISTAAHTSTVHKDVNNDVQRTGWRRNGAKVFGLGLVFQVIKFWFQVGFLIQVRPSFS